MSETSPPSVQIEECPASVPSPKKIAVFIDGQNLYGLTIALGVKIDYLKFLSYLCEELSPEAKLWAPPTITLSSHGMENMEDILRRMGFDPRMETRAGGDKLMINAIDQLPPEVDAIIVVTGDGDYIEALERAVARGISVSVVSLAERVRDNQAPTGRGYGCSYALRQNPKFKFVDIAEHIDALRLEDGSNESPPIKAPTNLAITPSTRRLSVEVEIPAELLRDASRWLADALTEFGEKFPEANATLRILSVT